MAFAKGFSDDKNLPSRFSTKTHSLKVNENVEVLFLEEQPTILYLHSYFDHRITNPYDNSAGMWTRSLCVEHTEGVNTKEYPYCPFCKAQRLRGQTISSSLGKRFVTTVFSFKPYQNKKGEERVNGRSLFVMTEKTSVSIANLKELKKKTNPNFSLKYALINCFRATDKDDRSGNQFTFMETKNIEEVKAQYPNYDFDLLDYEEIYKPLPLNVMEQEIRDIFPLKTKTPEKNQVRKPMPTQQRPAQQKPKSPTPPQVPDDYAYDEVDTFDSTEIPF